MYYQTIPQDYYMSQFEFAIDTGLDNHEENSGKTVADDCTIMTGITAEAIEKYMRRDSRHLAEDMVRICEETGVAPELIASIMRWEGNPKIHNWFGWMNSNGKLVRFDSDLECLECCIPRIKKLYLTEGGAYYNGLSVEGISVFYCGGSKFWKETMRKEISRIEEGEADGCES